MFRHEGAESESVPIESQADAAALVNDNFMWHNAATLLEEADARKQAGVIPLHSDDEEIQEFEADDDLEDEFSAKTANVPDALTIDEFEEEAIDERTMPMVTQMVRLVRFMRVRLWRLRLSLGVRGSLRPWRLMRLSKISRCDLSWPLHRKRPRGWFMAHWVPGFVFCRSL